MPRVDVGQRQGEDVRVGIRVARFDNHEIAIAKGAGKFLQIRNHAGIFDVGSNGADARASCHPQHAEQHHSGRYLQARDPRGAASDGPTAAAAANTSIPGKTTGTSRRSIQNAPGRCGACRRERSRRPRPR